MKRVLLLICVIALLAACAQDQDQEIDKQPGDQDEPAEKTPKEDNNSNQQVTEQEDTSENSSETVEKVVEHELVNESEEVDIGEMI